MDVEVSAGVGRPSPGIRASDLAGIELRHAIPGRVRLRIPGIKRQSALAGEVQRQLAALPVVRRVEVNAVTGSVLVFYDPVDATAIAQLGRMMIPGLDLDGMADRDPGSVAHVASTSSPTVAVAEFARRLNARVEATTGVADLRFLVPASLFVGGLIRLMATKKLPSPAWYDFLWFAFGTYFTLNGGIGSGDSAASEPAPESQPRPVRKRGVGAEDAMSCRPCGPRSHAVPDR